MLSGFAWSARCVFSAQSSKLLAVRVRAHVDLEAEALVFKF